MKKLLKVILILLGFVLICLVGLFFVPDEDLSPEALAWLKTSVDPDPEMNIYNGLLGLGVAADKDFIQEGIRIGQDINEYISEYKESFFWGEELSEVEAKELFDQLSSFTKPELEITFDKEQLCNPSEVQCLVFWQEENEMIDSFFQNNQMLLNRYQQLKKQTHYVNTTKTEVVSPFPKFQTPMNLSRFYTTHLAAEYLKHQKVTHLQNIYDELAFSRLLLVDADSLLEKMVAAALVRNAVYTLAQLIDASRLPTEMKYISQFSSEELSLIGIAEYEYKYNESLAQMMSKNPGETVTAFNLKFKVPKVFFPMFFKKNHFLNYRYRSIQQMARKSELTASDFLLVSKKYDESNQPEFMDHLINPVGMIFETVAGEASFDDFIQRQHDLNGLITLFNLKLSLLKEGASLENVDAFLESHSDQYYSPYRDQPIRYDVEKQELSFVSPDQNSRTNTLHLKLH